MVVAVSFLLPAALLVATREYLNEEHHSNIYIVIEYLISVLLINFVAIGIIILRGFSYNIAEYLTQYCRVAFQYMALSIAIAVVIPVLEIFIKSKAKLTLTYIPAFKIRSKTLNLLLYLYAFLLFSFNLLRVLDNVFWGDEVYSILMAKMNFSQMITTTAMDVHPPLYYILLQCFYHLFGNSGWAYHLATLLTFSILLLVSVTWIKKRFGIGTTTLFITFASLLSNAIEYNLEVRMYSMAELFVFLSFYMLYLIYTEQRVLWYALFTLFSLAAAYTHYYALLSVAFFYIALLLYTLYKKLWKTLPKVLVACLFTVLGYLPWLFTFLETWKRTTDNWWLTVTPTFKDCLEFLFQGKISNILWILLVILTIIVYIEKNPFILIRKHNHRHWDITINFTNLLRIDGETAWILTGMLSILGTIGVGIIASTIFRPVFQVKYLFPVSVAAWLLFSVECSKLKLRKVWLSLVIIIMLITGSQQFISFCQYEEKLDKSTKATLETVNDLGENPCVIINCGPLAGYTLEYYYPDISQVYTTILPDLKEYKDQNIWLFWTENLDDMLDHMEKDGTKVEFRRAGYIGINYVYIYHISSN